MKQIELDCAASQLPQRFARQRLSALTLVFLSLGLLVACSDDETEADPADERDASTCLLYTSDAADE